MQRALKTRGAGLGKVFALCALGALPMILGATCPGGLTVTLSGCPEGDIVAGSSFTITATAVTAVDGMDMDVTATTTFTYVVSQGPQTITLTGQGNTRTVNIPANVTIGATEITAEGDEPDAGTGSDSCTFNITAPPPCTDDASCDDDDACTTDTCTADGCENTAITCDDDLDCTDDTCAPATGCVFTDNCADPQVCNPDTGACAECGADTDCDDSDACTDDACGADGTCGTTPTNCDDGLACTTDTCDVATGCVNTSTCTAPTPFCTAAGCVECRTDADCDTAGGETCVNSACTGGEVPCTMDSECDDGIFCNGVETCVDLLCADGDPPCNPDTQTCDETDEVCDNIPGQTFVLTDNPDTFVGGGLVDTFSGVVQASGSTLSPGDNLDGGASPDIMNVVIVDANYAPVATIQRIENFFVFNADDATHSFNMAQIADAEQVWTDGSLSALEFTSLDHIVTVGVENTDQDVTATFNNSVLTGTSDTVGVALNGADGGDVIIQSSGSAGAETFAVTNVGNGANTVGLIDDGGENDFVELTINVTTALILEGVGDSLEIVDGSASSGALDIDLSNADGNDLEVTGGSGDDIFRIENLTSDVSIDGSGGTNTVEVNGTFEAAALANIQSATINNSGMTLTLDLENAQDLLTVNVDNTADIDELDATNLPPGFTLAIDTDVDFEIDTASNFSLLDDDGSSDAASLTFTGNANSVGVDNTIDIGEIEELSVQADVGQVDFFNSPSFIDGMDPTLELLNVSGSADVFFNDPIADTDTFEEINASTLTGDFDMDGPANDGDADIRIETGSGDDTLIGGNGNDTLISGAGNDDFLDGGDGDDTIDSGDGNDGDVNGGNDDDNIDTGSGNDDIEGGDGEDTIDAGSGNDTIDAGNDDDNVSAGSGNDNIQGGEGADDLEGEDGLDTFLFDGDHADSGDADNMDLEPGAGGDIISVDVANACGGAAANLSDANYAEGSPTIAANDSILVITSEEFDSFTDAETAIDAENANTTDYMLVFFNGDTGNAEVWLDDDSGSAGGCQLGTLESIGSLSELADLVAANFNTF